jgi:hypothetical protein
LNFYYYSSFLASLFVAELQQMLLIYGVHFCPLRFNHLKLQTFFLMAWKMLEGAQGSGDFKGAKEPGNGKEKNSGRR